MDLAVVIPAYRPGPEFPGLIHSLLQTPIAAVIVVNDGSEPEYERVFDQIRSLPRISYIRHGINLGKGAALKTGMNYAVCNFSHYRGVITADADGQHQDYDDPSAVIGMLSRRHEPPFEPSPPRGSLSRDVRFESPAVVISEIGLPAQDGLHLIQQVRTSGPRHRSS